MIAFVVALLALADPEPPHHGAPPRPPGGVAIPATLAGRVAPGVDGSAELILIGDTGEPGSLVDRWKVALHAEHAPAALVLGDLVYPQAPPCPTGTPDAAARAILESHIRAPFAATGKEVYLVLGNHDVSWVDGDPPRHLCLIRRFAKDPQVRLPAATYALDLGPAVLVVLDTNGLDDAQADFARAIVAASPGKRVIFAGHHVLRTYHDKDDEDRVKPWLDAHHLRPDMWVNGHAHLLQLVVRDGIVGVTSGTASKPRERPGCDRAAGTGECGKDELWGSSVGGYAILHIGPASEHAPLAITFKDADGKDLWRWQEPAVAPTVPSPTPTPGPASTPAPAP